jgi:hypothetical protein
MLLMDQGDRLRVEFAQAIQQGLLSVHKPFQIAPLVPFETGLQYTIPFAPNVP